MKEGTSSQGKESLVVLGAMLMVWIGVLILPRSEEVVPADRFGRETSLPILIVDPGHGGLDGGTSTADGKPESGFNLQIALQLRDLAAFLGIPTQMTREREELEYPTELRSIAEKKRWDTRRRVQEINATEHGYLLSIHQNYYPDTRPHGAQVLYAANEKSRQWGELTQTLLASCLDPENQRPAVPAQNSIYLMSHVQCPAILVECGFLSHPPEARQLGEPGYQLKLAAVLTESFLEITKENQI